MEEKERKRKESFLEKTAARLDLPTDVVARVPRLELNGDREIRLLGYGGILSYSHDEIHVGSGKWILRICGRSLEIQTMREGELFLTGWIDRLELV